MNTFLYPLSKQLVSKQDKEIVLNQRGVTIWLTGPSGSGKSTLACELEYKLLKRKKIATVLDGDNIRSGLNKDLKFDLKGREENIRRIAEVCKIINECGVIVISSFISPTEEIRNLAKEIIGPNQFIEVYVNCPLVVCEQRDVKGLYAKARKGLIPDFTGVHSPYEAPKNPHLEICTDQLSLGQSVSKILEYVLKNQNLPR